VVSYTLVTLWLGKSFWYPLNRRLGAPQSKLDTEEDSCHSWAQNHGCTAHSLSLYRVIPVPKFFVKKLCLELPFYVLNPRSRYSLVYLIIRATNGKYPVLYHPIQGMKAYRIVEMLRVPHFLNNWLTDGS
jgi:hypothetical protein